MSTEVAPVEAPDTPLAVRLQDLEVLETTFPKLQCPISISQIRLPTDHIYSFFVFRSGSYAALIDTGIKGVYGRHVYDTLMSSSSLLAGASECEIFITHDHADHTGYTLYLQETLETEFGSDNIHVVSRSSSGHDWRLVRERYEPVRLATAYLDATGIAQKRRKGYRCFRRTVGLITITLLIPPPCLTSTENRNHESFAVQFSTPMENVEHEPYRALFCGDFLFSMMRPFSHSIFQAVDFMAVPHHGSATYSSIELFEAIPSDVYYCASGSFAHIQFYEDEAALTLARCLAAANTRVSEGFPNGAFSDRIQFIVSNVPYYEPPLVSHGSRLPEDILVAVVDLMRREFEARIANFFLCPACRSSKGQPCSHPESCGKKPRWCRRFVNNFDVFATGDASAAKAAMQNLVLSQGLSDIVPQKEGIDFVSKFLRTYYMETFNSKAGDSDVKCVREFLAEGGRYLTLSLSSGTQSLDVTTIASSSCVGAVIMDISCRGVIQPELITGESVELSYTPSGMRSPPRKVLVNKVGTRNVVTLEARV